MFLDVKELAVRKSRIRKSYIPGTLDFHSGEFRQVEPLEVRATAELVGRADPYVRQPAHAGGDGVRALPGYGGRGNQPRF